MTKEQALAMAESGWWIGLPAREIVEFQLYEERLCMPFGDFHGAVEEALGRPVWTHEFADVRSLREELNGERPGATFEEVLAKIPEDKRLLIVGL